MSDDKNERPDGPPASILSARLAVDPEGPVPAIGDLGLEAAKTAGFAWQEQRSYARWNELVAAFGGRAASDWVHEIHGMFGVIGEQILVATEAEVEKAIASARLAALDPDAAPQRASASRSLRFFAEGQANALVVAAHGVANLTLRTLALDPAFDVADVKAAGISKADFAPGSEAKNAWVSLTATTCGAFAAAAPGYAPEMQALAARLKALQANAAVSGLIGLRNVQYHRWRGESPGVTGVNLQAPTQRQLLEQGQAVGLSAELLPPYTEGQAALDELVTASRDALDAIVGELPAFREAWPDAFQATFG